MSTLLDRVFDAYMADNTRSQKADSAINTLVSCFGESFTDVIHEDIRKEANPEWDSTLRRYINDGASEDVIMRHLNSRYPKWAVVIKFPHEVVTNEFGRWVDIYDFFIKVTLNENGTLHDTRAIKATYTEDQMYSCYTHSHCHSLCRTEEGIKEWLSMCFGSGPINITMSALRYPNYEDLLWVGFASELRQWVRTESVSGGPYFRLDNISKKYREVTDERPHKPFLMDNTIKLLTKSYIKSGRLKVGYSYGRFCLGTTFAEWLVDFSEYAKAWSEKTNHGLVFHDTLIVNNKVCEVENNSSETYNDLIGKPVLTFKGEVVGLKIIQGYKIEHLSLLNYKTGLYIIKTILDTINYNYGRTTNTETQEAQAAPVQWR